MDIVDQVVEQVQIRFTVTDGDHTYSDALYFTPAEYAAKTPEEIEAMKLERFERWKAVVTAPPRELTEEDKQAQIASLTQQQLDTQEQLKRLTPGDQMLSILEQQLALVTADIERLQGTP